MLRIRSMTGVLAAVLLVGALPVSVAGQETFPYGESDLVGITWDLTSYLSEGALTNVPDGVEPTLLLEDGKATGSGGCNSFSGSYQLEEATPGVISFGAELLLTLALCEDPAQSVEDTYLALLPTINSWTLVDGALQLNDASEGPVLMFAADATGEPVEPVEPEADLDAVLARLVALSEQVADLQARVTSLEGDAEPSGGSGEAPTSRPRAPAASGEVQTAFPSQDVDPERGLVTWQDRSDDEAGFRIYARRGFCALRGNADPDEPEDDDFRLRRGRFVRIDRVAPDSVQYRPRHAAIEAELPEAPRSQLSNDEFYDLYVTAYSSEGETRRIRVGSYFLTPEFNCP